MHHRRIVVIALLVGGLAVSYGMYQATDARPVVVRAADNVAVIPAAEAAGRASDASQAAARPTVAANTTIHLPDALEGLDSREYRITKMLCQDLY